MAIPDCSINDGGNSIHRVPMETAQRVLTLYQDKYFDFNVRHFHEKLREVEGIQLSYSWVKQALQGAGLVARKKKRGPHRQRRPRRPWPGMLLHIDGSKHRWFQDDRYYDLIVILDDATSEIYYAQLVEEESTRTVMAALKEVIECKGLFCALYSDRASHFFVTPKAGEPVDKTRLTQVGRVKRTRSPDDPGLLATRSRTHGAQLWNLAGPAAAGITIGSNHQLGSRQSVFAPALYRRVQFAVCGAAGAARYCLSEVRAARSGLGVLDSNRAGGRQGQHGSDSRSMVATGQNPLATHPGGPDRNHPSTLGWKGFDSLRTSPGRPWKRRARGKRGKPNPGFPPFPPPLGSAPADPLSHRRDEILSRFKTKAEEGSLKPNRTTNVSTKPDNYKS
jgi:hypothetical protein